jgi:hypothetical protein
MTHDRDIERVIEEWLRPGPVAMPDRLFDDVLDRIEHVPQRRLVRTVTRWFQMTPSLRLAAVAAVVIVVIGAALLFTRPASNVGTSTPSPSPSPSSSAAATTAGSDLPESLGGHWYTMSHQAASSGLQPLRLSIESSDLAVDWTSNIPSGLQSRASLTSNGTKLRVETRNVGTDCPVGAVGEYNLAVSPRGTRLTLSNGSDACPLRATVLSGGWAHSACKLQQQGVADDDCLGELEAGGISTNYFSPYAPIGVPVDRTIPGALSFEVPAGWANQQDWPWLYVLMPSSEYESSRSFENGEVDAISIWAHPLAAVLGPNCSYQVAPGVGHSANELAAWLSTNSTVKAGPVSDLGHAPRPGRVVDVSPNPKYTATCPGEASPLAPTFTSVTGYQVAMGGSYPHRSRYVFIDIGDNESVLVLIESRQKADFVQADFDQFAQRAMSIVTTMQFVP